MTGTRSRASRRRRLLSAVAVGTLAGLAVTAPAHADSDDWEITRYDVVAQLEADGGAQVRVDLDFDFGPDQDAHGPYLTIVERQEIAGDPDRYRVLEVSDVQVTSSTGAPTDLLVEREDGAVLVRVGDEDVEIGGTQSYTVSYHLDALVTPVGVGGGTTDAVVWNAVGLGWEVPLSDVSVTLDTEVAPVAVRCFAGGVGSTTPCEGVEGGGATVTHERLDPGQGLTLNVDYPAGTFPYAAVAYAPRRTLGNTFGITPATGAVGGAALVGGTAAAVVALRRRRDVEPAAGPGSHVADGGGDAGGAGIPEGFRTEPPADVPPGELGTLIDERAQPHDVVAVLLDLAVRGAVHIEVVPDEEDDEPLENADFQLVRPGEPADLRPYERELLGGIFGGRDTVLVSERHAEIAAAFAAASVALDATVTERGWFAGSPRKVRAAWLLGGFGLVLGGLAAAVVLALTIGWGIVGIAIAVVGIVTMCVAPAMPSRTARGSELTRQARAFERYLRDVTSDRPTWAKGRERLLPTVFEQYLPYAVALQLEKEWTGAFTDAVERGELQQPDWYVGPHGIVFATLWSSGGFSQSLAGLGSGVVSTPAGSSAGSSASFSAGGGASGGGGGGW